MILQSGKETSENLTIQERYVVLTITKNALYWRK